jgi:hypothetical protein
MFKLHQTPLKDIISLPLIKKLHRNKAKSSRSYNVSFNQINALKFVYPPNDMRRKNVRNVENVGKRVIPKGELADGISLSGTTTLFLNTKRSSTVVLFRRPLPLPGKEMMM